MTYEYKGPLQERDGDFKVTDGDITGATNANWDDAHDKRVDDWVEPLEYEDNTASINQDRVGNWDDAYEKRVDEWVHPLQYLNNTASFDTENPDIDHHDLSDLSWLSSGHIGTPDRVVGFNGLGMASEYDVEDPITLANDTIGFVKGSDDGHILFWSESAGTWLPSNITDLKWDSDLKTLKVNTTTQTTRLLAGGIS
jgi:hypothetical protein